VPAVNPFSLPFDEAIDYFKKKNIVSSDFFALMSDAMKQRAFTVAGLAREDMLADIHGAILDALEKGTTLEIFKKNFGNIMSRAGWDFTEGRAWRVAIIFDTNLSCAYAAGRWKQQTDPDVLKVRPYLRYLESSSVEPRDEHLAWVNTVLPADDPWWDTHYPPNDWGCKCGVESVSEGELEKLEKEFSGGNNPIKRDAPPGDAAEGWNYNPGKTQWGWPE
jgi:uncharacterized protein with gpF-like domain